MGYICFVNRTTAILLRKMTAGIFLALFLFVHGAKSMHGHHVTQPISKQINGSLEVFQESDCSVCDYQLSKDSYPSIEFEQLKNNESLLSLYASYNTPFVTSIGSTSSGRGPPALI
jgi:hypothetical protein